MKPARRPIVIEHVRPAVDDGRYPAKRVVGDVLAVSADIFKEGHDLLAARICYRLVTVFIDRLRSTNEQAREAIRWGLEATGYSPINDHVSFGRKST